MSAIAGRLPDGFSRAYFESCKSYRAAEPWTSEGRRWHYWTVRVDSSDLEGVAQMIGGQGGHCIVRRFLLPLAVAVQLAFVLPPRLPRNC